MQTEATTLSPEQAAQLPLYREALIKAIKDIAEASANLGGTGEFHIAGQLRIGNVRRADPGAGTAAVVVPIEMIGVGPVTELLVDRDSALVLIAALAQALQ
jgi:hypothetical protein